MAFTFTPSAAGTGTLNATVMPGAASSLYTSTAVVTNNSPAMAMTGATYGAGRFGQALTGGSGMVMLAHDVGQGFTLDFWFQAASNPSGDHDVVILAPGSGSFDYGSTWRFITSGTGASFGLACCSGSIAASYNVGDGAWHHLMMQQAPDGTFHQGVDGAIINQNNYGPAQFKASNPVLAVQAEGTSGGTVPGYQNPASGAGHIDTLRFRKGARFAVSSGTYAVPGSPAYDGDTVGLYQLDGQGGGQ